MQPQNNLEGGIKMRKKIFSFLLTVTILTSIIGGISTTTNAADEPKNLNDAAILPNGNLAILYINSGDIYFGILDPDSNNWSKSKVAEGKEAAFDLDSNGYPHVAYITNDDNLGYIFFDGTSWSNAEIIDSIAFDGVDGALSSPDIAVDSNGNAHISYLDAKGGYTDGNNYAPYEKEDLIYTNNTGGAFVKEVISYSHGWFYSPDGWRNLVYAPTKITLTNDVFVIGAKQYQYDKWMSGQYHTYNYNLYFPATSLSYDIRSASTNNDLGFKLFEISSDGSTVYSLFNKSGSLYVTAGVTELTEATKPFAASGADLFVTNDSKIYYAGISANNLLLYQNGVFKENITLPDSISSTHTRVSTVVDSSKQYVLYTDSAGELWVCNVSTNSGDLTLNSYKIPDKLPVTIDGVTIENKVYDGEAIVPTGTLSVTGGNLTAEDLLFTYTSTDGAGYNSTTPPINVGNYKLIISVPEENPTYIGNSNEIFFSITPKALTIAGTTAIDRNYEVGNIFVALNTDNSSLLGVLASDELNVSLDKSEASGAIEDSNAANDKIVTVTGFKLIGSLAANYSLIQPTDVKVNILPKETNFTIEAIDSQDYTGNQITPNAIVKDEEVILVQNVDYTISYGPNTNAGLNAGTIFLTGIGNYEGSSGIANFTVNKVSYSGAPVTGLKQVISNTAADDVTFNLNDLYFPSGFVNNNFDSVNLTDNVDGLITDYALNTGNSLIFNVASLEAGKSAIFNVIVSSTNYNDYIVTITITTVDKSPVTITGVSVADKTYDGNPIVASGTPTNSDGYTGNYEYLYVGTGSTIYSSGTPPTNAGSYNLIVRIPIADPTYTGQQNISFNIEKAILTVKPKNMTIYSNDALPTPTVEYVGLIGTDVGAEVATLKSGNLDMEIKDTDGNTALSNSTITGEYAIKFIGLPIFNEAQNYIITTNDGVLTINSRPSGGSSSSSYYPSPTISVTTEETTNSTTNKTEISASTSSSTASASISTAVVNALIDKATQTGGTEKKDIIEIAIDIQNHIDELKVSILQSDLGEIVTNTDSSLSITSQFVSTTFDKKALETISSAGTGGNVVFTTRIIDSNLLFEADRGIVQDRPIYDLTVMNGNKQISDFNGGYATITIPYTLKPGENPNAVVIFYLADDGNLEIVRGHYDSELKVVIFKTKHFSKFVIGYNPFVFSDVSTDAWYKDAVDFIATREITLGTGDNKFSPDTKLTRAQFVVLLMNAYQINLQNQDELNQNQNFTDAGNTYYTDYLLVAKNLGIVKGVGNNMFAPEKEITRQEMFVMLYNALKIIDEAPTASFDKTLSTFNDADQVATWANEALSTLVRSGIISGSTNNNINPKSGTTRAEIAQVLYNLLAKQ